MAIQLETKLVLQAFKSCVPQLVFNKHKGQCGRIGVIGGSKEYTGAPYFAGISALLAGADLSHIICTEAAAPVIKGYSPELIVHPILDKDGIECKKWIDRFHAVVVGPGLGVEENINMAEELIADARKKDKPIVIDADGLYVVLRNPDVIRNYTKAVLTPNVVEFGRLYAKLFGDKQPTDSPEETRKMSASLGGVTIVQKGPVDVISDGKHIVICDMIGSPRRCGGQGDLLSGTLGLFAFWTHVQESSESVPPMLSASYGACLLTRQCAQSAVIKLGRSTLTNNIIDEIRTAFPNLFD